MSEPAHLSMGWEEFRPRELTEQSLEAKRGDRGEQISQQAIWQDSLRSRAAGGRGGMYVLEERLLAANDAQNWRNCGPPAASFRLCSPTNSRHRVGASSKSRGICWTNRRTG